MTSEEDEDLIRFHNGDTLDNIPVVRPREGPSSPPLRTLLITVAVAALVSGSAVGWALSRGGQDTSSEGSTKAAETSVSPPPSVSPRPAPTVTVWHAPSVTSQPEARLAEAVVSVVQAPTVGGDPSVDYCLSYTGSFSGGVPEAILLANAPAYRCDDLVFSTHPSDGTGVWESEIPDCSRTDGARSTFVVFGESTGWYGADAYTCLLGSHGA